MVQADLLFILEEIFLHMKRESAVLDSRLLMHMVIGNYRTLTQKGQLPGANGSR